MYKKQSGGRGKFADIIVNIGPADADFTLDVYKRQLRYTPRIGLYGP